MTQEERLQVAKAMWEAEQKGGKADWPRQRYPHLQAEDAYGIQGLLTGMRVDNGEELCGYKVAFSAPGAIASMGLGEPAYATLVRSKIHEAMHTVGKGSPVTGVEPEILFVMGKDLEGDNVTEEDVLAAAKGIYPAFELIAPRMEMKGASALDLICQGVSFGGVVRGEELPIDEVPALSGVKVQVLEDGVELAEGEGSNVYGDPVRSVAWLARKLTAAGKKLQAGDLILSGSFTPIIPIKPGCGYTAAFEGVGQVALGFE